MSNERAWHERELLVWDLVQWHRKRLEVGVFLGVDMFLLFRWVLTSIFEFEVGQWVWDTGWTVPKEKCIFLVCPIAKFSCACQSMYLRGTWKLKLEAHFHTTSNKPDLPQYPSNSNPKSSLRHWHILPKNRVMNQRFKLFWSMLNRR